MNKLSLLKKRRIPVLGALRKKRWIISPSIVRWAPSILAFLIFPPQHPLKYKYKSLQRAENKQKNDRVHAIVF